MNPETFQNLLNQLNSALLTHEQAAEVIETFETRYQNEANLYSQEAVDGDEKMQNFNLAQASGHREVAKRATALAAGLRGLV